MSLREMPVRQVMTVDVVTFNPADNVQVAMQQLVERGVDAGPVVDDSGEVVGMLSTGDLIVEEARVHFPTVVNFFGVNVTWPFDHKELDDTVSKALGASVGEVMTTDPITIDSDASVEEAATVMHDRDLSRLPVLDAGGHLVGILARGDIVKAIVQGVGEGQ
jgi:CBS domain-containing protein